ncbi:MAG: hypothetical protein LC790_11765 [Actinobacteria bacterium]|nr:hypothetical protein [Actinomycetota bacterium]
MYRERVEIPPATSSIAAPPLPGIRTVFTTRRWSDTRISTHGPASMLAGSTRGAPTLTLTHRGVQR